MYAINLGMRKILHVGLFDKFVFLATLNFGADRISLQNLSNCYYYRNSPSNIIVYYIF